MSWVILTVRCYGSLLRKNFVPLSADLIFFSFGLRACVLVGRGCFDGPALLDTVQDFMAVNLAHGMLRRRLVTPDKMGLVEETIGKEGAGRFLDSGITGVTPGKVNISGA